MATSIYKSQGSKQEQLFHEDLIVESLKFYGQDVFYIPRTLVAKDEILGEDRLSEFKEAYPVEMYFENVDGFDGQGAFIQKFGLMMEQSATLVVARRRWHQFIGRFGNTIIPERPCEGDLIYFPLTDALFEIKFVKHQDPFYQIGKLYVYKLQVELFQYASEHIDTGVADIDGFEQLKSYDVNVVKNGVVTHAFIDNDGYGYDTAPTLQFGINWTSNTSVVEGTELNHLTHRWIVTADGITGNTAPTHTGGTVGNGTAALTYAGTRAAAVCTVGGGDFEGRIVNIEITNGGSKYEVAPLVFVLGGGGTGAEVTAFINDIDAQVSYGDNNKFKQESVAILFNENNPFGDFNV